MTTTVATPISDNIVRYTVLDAFHANHIVGKTETFADAVAVRDDLLQRHPAHRYRYTIRPRKTR